MRKHKPTLGADEFDGAGIHAKALLGGFMPQQFVYKEHQHQTIEL